MPHVPDAIQWVLAAIAVLWILGMGVLAVVGPPILVIIGIWHVFMGC
ncbi:MAG: hypothetical protein OEY86_00990 [Nitrospira sp.]|nr:hypothetical protein [Nitrospira sp.]